MQKAAKPERLLCFTEMFLQFAVMAKQVCNYITGTIDDLCFYEMDGQYYVRMKSSLTAKRVKTSKAFIKTMESAKQLGVASVIASKVYRKIDKERGSVQWYRKMTGMAKLLLKDGVAEQKIIERLTEDVAIVLESVGTIDNNKEVIKPVLRSINYLSDRPVESD